jgi:hypothetical protein
MKPQFTKLEFTYKKADADVAVFNMDDLPLNQETIKDIQLIHLGPQSIGGNHTHPRTEWFIALGDLVLHWLDENGLQHSEHMNPEGKLLLIKVPPQLPHAVENISASESAVLYEMADAKMSGVEKVTVKK